MEFAKWSKAVDVVSLRTAMKIRRALESMVNTLPDGAAPQMVLELVVRDLASMTETPPIDWLMQLLMEDPHIREAYWAAVAAQPLPRRKKESRIV